MPTPLQGPRSRRESETVTDNCYRKPYLSTWHLHSPRIAIEGPRPWFLQVRCFQETCSGKMKGELELKCVTIPI